MQYDSYGPMQRFADSFETLAAVTFALILVGILAGTHVGTIAGALLGTRAGTLAGTFLLLVRPFSLANEYRNVCFAEPECKVGYNC